MQSVQKLLKYMLKGEPNEAERKELHDMASPLMKTLHSQD